MFAQVIQEHLELKRRNSALEHEMPLGKYMHDDPFENHPLFKTEEQARIEDTMDGVRGHRVRTRRHSTGRPPTTRSSTQPQTPDAPSSPPRRTGDGRARRALRREPLVALARLRLGRLDAPRTWFAQRTRFARPHGWLSLAQRLSSMLLDRPEGRRAAEVERAGGEDLRAADRLVVAHLRRDARAEEVGDLGEHQRPRR